MPRKILKPSTSLLPCPIGLITVQGNNGKPNIITLAWLGILASDPPMVSISIRPNRFSSRLIKENGDFVINIPSADDLKKVDYCGTTSGKTVDKIKECNFTTQPASKAKAVILLECPINIECRTRQILNLGTHDVFISEILAIQIKEDVLDENDKWLMNKINPLAYCPPTNEYWTLGNAVGKYGFSQGKNIKKE